MQKPILLCTLLLCASGHARTLHVSQTPLKSVAVDAQFRSIGEAAKAVAAGDGVVIHEGTYRESVVIDAKGSKEQPIRFEAATAARVIVTGADRITSWQKAETASPDNIYVTDWPYRFITWNKTMAHPDDQRNFPVLPATIL